MRRGRSRGKDLSEIKNGGVEKERGCGGRNIKTEHLKLSKENEVRKNSLSLLPCKYHAGRVVTGGLGTTGLEMDYRRSWSPGHG